jgi:hypothetical protein
MDTSRWLRNTGQTLSKNSPTILSASAIIGVVATAVLAVRATPKAHKKIIRLRIEKGDLPQYEKVDFEPTPFDLVRLTWKPYFPAILAGAATIACIVGTHQIGMRRNAALFAAYGIADTAFREYKEEVVHQLGANKERKVVDAAAAKKMDATPVVSNQVIITGGGEQLCFDSLTGRYFRSDVEKIRRAENEINRRINQDMFASHNEFYELLGLDPVAVGDELGWNIDNFIELIFTSHLASDGQPAISLGYARLPRASYGKF